MSGSKCLFPTRAFWIKLLDDELEGHSVSLKSLWHERMMSVIVTWSLFWAALLVSVTVKRSLIWAALLMSVTVKRSLI